MHDRSIIEAIQDTDGFKYSERSAQSKEGGDGARLKVRHCQDNDQFLVVADDSSMFAKTASRTAKATSRKKGLTIATTTRLESTSRGPLCCRPTTAEAQYTSNSHSRERP